MTESVNTPIVRSANITKPHIIKTGMNINQNLFLKQRAPQSFGISQYMQIEKVTPVSLIFSLKIIKTTPVYWLNWCFLWIKTCGEFGKISKYLDLEIEIERTWQLKPTLIPVVVRALGTVKKGKNKYLQ